MPFQGSFETSERPSVEPVPSLLAREESGAAPSTSAL